jgi:glycine/D-amino acid oxidase-like deaminating enzyme
MPSFKRLEGDKKCDVLIIGGGMAGILTAYLLEKQGTNYILVEKDRICGGTTGNTTAKITYQHGLIYDKLSRSFVLWRRMPTAALSERTTTSTRPPAPTKSSGSLKP